MGAVAATLVMDAVSSAQKFVSVFIYVYSLLIFAYVLTSWIRLPYSLNWLQRFLYDVCEPYLRFWRRVLRLQFGGFDFSAIIGILAVYLVARIVNVILDQFH